jgi:replicative DNA helicase
MAFNPPRESGKKFTMPKTLREIAMEERIVYREEMGDSSKLVKTGIRELDEVIGGLFMTEVTVVAGRPGSAKSATSFQISEHISEVLKIPLLMFSFEMKANLIFARYIAAKTGIPVIKQMERSYSAYELNKIEEVVEKMIDARFHIDDVCGRSIEFVLEMMRNAAASGVKVFVIDYIGLVEGQKGANRQEEVAYVSRALKQEAMELNVAVLLLSQLNRETEKTANGRGSASNLSESDQLTRDAGTIIIVHREELTNANSREAGIIELIVAKNRYGAPSKTVKMGWDGKAMRVVSLHDGPAPFENPYGQPTKRDISEFFG